MHILRYTFLLISGGSRYQNNNDLDRKGGLPEAMPGPGAKTQGHYAIGPLCDTHSRRCLWTFEVFLSFTEQTLHTLHNQMGQRASVQCPAQCLSEDNVLLHGVPEPMHRDQGQIRVWSRGDPGSPMLFGEWGRRTRHIRTLNHCQNVAPSWRLVGQLFKVACFCLQHLQTGQHSFRLPILHEMRPWT